LLPMSFQELLPRRLSAAFRRRLDPVSLQNIRDRVVGQDVPQIGERSLDPAITPRSILFGHAYDQRGDFLSRWTSARCSERTAVIFLYDQFSVPRQECFRCAMVATFARS